MVSRSFLAAVISGASADMISAERTIRASVILPSFTTSNVSGSGSSVVSAGVVSGGSIGFCSHEQKSTVIASTSASTSIDSRSFLFVFISGSFPTRS